MLDPVTANFLGDNLRCWMQIQVGQGPTASEVSGIVKIGQTMTMVLGVKDDENKFDMMVSFAIANALQNKLLSIETYFRFEIVWLMMVLGHLFSWSTKKAV